MKDSISLTDIIDNWESYSELKRWLLFIIVVMKTNKLLTVVITGIMLVLVVSTLFIVTQNANIALAVGVILGILISELARYIRK